MSSRLFLLVLVVVLVAVPGTALGLNHFAKWVFAEIVAAQPRLTNLMLDRIAPRHNGRKNDPIHYNPRPFADPEGGKQMKLQFTAIVVMALVLIHGQSAAVYAAEQATEDRVRSLENRSVGSPRASIVRKLRLSDLLEQRLNRIPTLLLAHAPFPTTWSSRA